MKEIYGVIDMRKADQEKVIADALVARFDASGVKYTCVATVFDVIREPAIEAVRGTAIRYRRVMNLALDTLHARNDRRN